MKLKSNFRLKQGLKYLTGPRGEKRDSEREHRAMCAAHTNRTSVKDSAYLTRTHYHFSFSCVEDHTTPSGPYFDLEF
jgi:hypothetical protein